ncbi:odontogenesis associated phosphoprotein [Ctenodactylus gundi]
MAHGLCFSGWALACWLVATAAKACPIPEARSQLSRHWLALILGVPGGGLRAWQTHLSSGQQLQLLPSPLPRQEVVIPPGGPQNTTNPTDCQIFTLTPPPTTRNPTTKVQLITRAPKYPFLVFPQRPRVYPRLPPFHPPNCNHHFQFPPFYWPYPCLRPGRCFLGRKLQGGSSSEESREKREVQVF